ncbi:hypothetical protein K2173_022599 [Erythroxylum novogranatense]|uniref:Protein kinase domain-containing protein n=1 Tax=Erythroxylum novogranatense TaxID=1862640 RepID=A0AAV8TNI0_9ROSI|nr:hypothetical protein K2173_022599 [Erythroxylum novogranatense]
MEQFRQIGEVLGSLKALMVLQDDIQINQRQCCLLLDISTLAFTTIGEEIKLNLKLEEKNTKWKPLEEPLRELYRILKEVELYVRRCLDHKDWWGKVVYLHQNKDSVEFHIHNLLNHFPAVIEAIETAGEISGLDRQEMQRKRIMLAKKYDRCWTDPKLFQTRFGKQYLIPREICSKIETAISEDRWLLIEAIKQKKNTGSLTKNENRLGDLLLKKLNGQELVNGKLAPSSILIGGEDYQVRRRLGGGSQFKEIQWLGEGFALRHFFENIEPLRSEISTLLSLSHPNIVQYLCGFSDEENKECFLVMELMVKDLYSHMKESSSPRRRILFPLPVVVDIMLQVARGMEYLHSRKVCHGDLNPSNVYIKPRKASEGYFHVKVSGFGLTSVENHPSHYSSTNQNAVDPCIWHAPEVLAEKQQAGKSTICKYTEKADVYSFGMLCFELLTGKLPFEDGHLQGDLSQMIKNIRAGERPLFPFLSPKYLVNLTKKCWHTDPSYRPSFSSICRVLRYVKKFLAMNPVDDQPDMKSPPVDYSDLEVGFLKKFPGESSSESTSMSQIPFQMFVYKLVEREKTALTIKFKNSESASEGASNGWDENNSFFEDPILLATDVAPDTKAVCFDVKSVCPVFSEMKMPSDLRSVRSEPAEKNHVSLDNNCESPGKKTMSRKKTTAVRMRKATVKPKPLTVTRSLPWNPPGYVLKGSREGKASCKSPLSPGNRRSFTQSTRT